MSFKFCYQKKIRQRTERIFSDVYDFCEASRFCNLTMGQHPKLFFHFEDRYASIADYFDGVTFKNDNCYWQVLSDVSFARDIIRRDNLHIGLIPYLEMLIDDLVEMKNGNSDVVPS